MKQIQLNFTNTRLVFVNFFLYLFHSRVAEFAGMEYLRSMIMGKVRIIASIVEINRSTIVEIVTNSE